jgi:exopolysaccharide production protein ExoQ
VTDAVWSGRRIPESAHAVAVERRPATAKTLMVLFAITGVAPFSGSGPIVFALAVAALAHAWAANRIERPSRVVLLFVLWCACSIAWSVAPSLTVRAVLVTTALVIAVNSLVRHLPRAQVLWALATAMKALVVLSWVAYLMLPAIGQEQVLYQQGALRGVFVQRNTAAFVMAVAVLTFAVMATGAATARERLSAVAWLSLSVITLLATSSGTGLVVSVTSLGLLGGVVSLGRLSSFTKKSVLMFLVAIVTVAAASAQKLVPMITELLGRDNTLTGRTVIWAAIWPHIEQQPWIGYGWGALWTGGVPVTERMWAVAAFDFEHAHDAFLDATLQIGLVGMSLLVLVCVATLVRAGRRLLSPEDAVSARWPLVVTVCLMLYGIAEQSFMSYFGLVVLVTAWTLVGHTPPERHPAGSSTGVGRPHMPA